MDQERVVALVRDVRQGRVGAETDLYNACYTDLYYYILKIVNNDGPTAEDILQETFFTIFRYLHQLNEPAAFIGWSRKIAYNKCLEYFSKDKDQLIYESDDGYSALDTLEEDRTEFIPDEALDHEELRRTILQMVEALPPEQKSAVLMRYFDDLSVKEIAWSQGVSEGTVKSRLNYARNAIRKAVIDYESRYGIRLRCAGVAPLLWWLFRKKVFASGTAAVVGSYTAATGAAAAQAASVTTGAAAAAGASGAGAGAAAGAGGTAWGGSTVSAGGSAAVKQGVSGGIKAGVAAAKKAVATKIIAGATAAAVVTGGVTATVVLTQEDRKTQPDAVVETTENPLDASGVWIGYCARNPLLRYTVTVEELNEEEIRGDLTATQFYNEFYASEFTGTGETEDGVTTFEITFDNEEFTRDAYETVGFTEGSIIYDHKEQTLTLKDEDDSILRREDSYSDELLEKKTVWSGALENGIAEDTPLPYTRTVEVKFDKMDILEVTGHIKILDNAQVIYESDFKGEGNYVEAKGYVVYSIVAEEPFHEEFGGKEKDTPNLTMALLYSDQDEPATVTFQGISQYTGKLTKNP